MAHFAAGSSGQLTIVSAVVESSVVDSMEWNNFSGDAEMIVRFHSGDAYAYKGVTLAIFMIVAQAQSVGKALNDTIKGKYEYKKMPSRQPVPA